MVTRLYHPVNGPRRRLLVWLSLAATLALSLMGRTAQAQGLVPRDLTPDEWLEGKMKVQAPAGTKVEITWTDLNHADLKGKEEKFTMPVGGSQTVDVPFTVDGSMVWDAWVFNIKPNGLTMGAMSSTHFEAYTRQGADLLITPFTYAAGEITGGLGEIVCPTVYADTNGDGNVDLGDHLYSMVNLYEYTQAGMPSVNVGDMIKIADGISPTYPGMYFGTEPIVPDATMPGGYRNPSPVTLAGRIEGRQSVSAAARLPEPATCSLMAGAIVLLAVRRMRRRTH
jgi:hypothetical protein